MSLQWYALPSKPSTEEPLWRGVHALGLEVLHPQSERPLGASGSQKLCPGFPGTTFTNMHLPGFGPTALMPMLRSEQPLWVLPKPLEKAWFCGHCSPDRTRKKTDTGCQSGKTDRRCQYQNDHESPKPWGNVGGAERAQQEIEMMPEKLKLGLLLDSFQVPAWVYKAIQQVANGCSGEFKLVILNADHDRSRYTNRS